MKIKVKRLVILLVSIIFFCGTFNVLFYKSENGLTELKDTCSPGMAISPVASVSGLSSTYDTYLEAYFSNLNYNFGRNYKGSCAFVATGMILSYFDTCFNDDIISEDYDVVSNGAGRNMNLRANSPGVLNEMYDKAVEAYSAQEYYNYLMEYEKYSFHAQLILYANNLKGLYNFDDNNNPCGVTMSEIADVLKCYLMYKRGFKLFEDFNVYSIESDNEQEVKQFVIDKLDQGLPVYTCLTGSAGGHATVAYAHNGKGEIYLHSGWHGFGTRQTVSSLGFTKMYRALAIKFFSDHKHSNNYGVTKGGNTEYYCACSEDILAYYHNSHKYNIDYANIDSYSHNVFCVCGAFITENHSYTDKYEKYSNDYHKSYCKCGASINQSHTWTMVGNSNVSPSVIRFVKCISCGFNRKLGINEPVPIVPNKKNDYV